MDEILRNFYASLQPVIARYRLQQGLFVIEHYTKRVNDERRRTLQKIEGLDSGVDVAEAKARVNALADGEIARAQADGYVEYNLPAALRVRRKNQNKKGKK
jgi:hypothetical protein